MNYCSWMTTCTEHTNSLSITMDAVAQALPNNYKFHGNQQLLILVSKVKMQWAIQTVCSSVELVWPCWNSRTTIKKINKLPVWCMFCDNLAHKKKFWWVTDQNPLNENINKTELLLLTIRTIKSTITVIWYTKVSFIIVRILGKSACCQIFAILEVSAEEQVQWTQVVVPCAAQHG